MSFPFLAPSPWERAGVRSGSPDTRNPSGDTFKSSNLQILKFSNPQTLELILQSLNSSKYFLTFGKKIIAWH